MLFAKGGYVYFMSNTHNTTIYIGVTADLRKRIFEHREGIDKTSFTFKYSLTKLVYWEFHQTIEAAIDREKQLKKTNRKKKEALIESMNPERLDLCETIEEF